MNKYALALLLLLTIGSNSQYTKFMNSSGDYVVWINNFGAQNLCDLTGNPKVYISAFANQSGNFSLYYANDDVICQSEDFLYDVDCRYTNQESQDGNLQIQFQNDDSYSSQFFNQSQNIVLCQGYTPNGTLQQYRTQGYKDNYDASIFSVNYQSTECIYSNITQYRYLNSETLVTETGDTYTLTLPFVSSDSKTITCYDEDNTQSVTEDIASSNETVISNIPFFPLRCEYDGNTYILTSIVDGSQVYLSSFELGIDQQFNPGQDNDLIYYTIIDDDGTCNTDPATDPAPNYAAGTAMLNFVQAPISNIESLQCFNSQDQLVDTITLSTSASKGSILSDDTVSCYVFGADQNILQCGLITKQTNQLVFSQLPQQEGVKCISKQSVTVYNIQDKETGDICQTQCYIDTVDSDGTYNYKCQHYYDETYTIFDATSSSRNQLFVLPQCEIGTGSKTITLTDQYGNKITSTTDYGGSEISTDYVEGQNLPSVSYFVVINRFLREFSRQ